MTIRVFASGQSNMLGAGTGGPSLSTVSADVRVWNSVAPLGSIGNAFVTSAAAQAAGTFQFTDRNNFAVWFCDRLARTQFDTVDLTLVARNGSGIALWSPDEVTTPLLTRCAQVYGASAQAPADVFLWHQGESDLDNAGYRDQLSALVANLKAAGVLRADASVILCGLSESDASRVAFNRDMLLGSANRQHWAYVSTYLAPTYDGVHFTGQGLYQLGASRCYSAYLYARRKG